MSIMLKHSTYLLFTLLILASTSACDKINLLQDETGDTQQALLEQPAPNFKLSSATGASHSLDAYKGKYVILEWTNFDCPYVKKHYESGNMPALQKKYVSEGAIWLTVSSSASGKQGHFSPKEIQKRKQQYKAEYTAYLLDSKGEVGKLYGAKTTPHMYVISPEGSLIYQGAIDSIDSYESKDIPKAKNYVALAIDTAKVGKSLQHPSTAPYGCSVKY